MEVALRVRHGIGLFGSGQVGKTQLRRRLEFKPFDTSCPPTIGVDMGFFEDGEDHKDGLHHGHQQPQQLMYDTGVSRAPAPWSRSTARAWRS